MTNLPNFRSLFQYKGFGIKPARPPSHPIIISLCTKAAVDSPALIGYNTGKEAVP